MTLFGRIQPALFTIVCGCLLLVACAEESPGPQFAIDPMPTRPPTKASLPIATPLPVATPVGSATPASIRDLLSPRGAAARVYVASADAVWSIESSGQSQRLFEATNGSRILAIDPAPGGEHVAVLLDGATRSRRGPELVIFDRVGKELVRIDGFAGLQATPTARLSSGIGRDIVDWSPQGDQILVALRDGGIFSVRPDGDSSPELLNIGIDGKQVVAPSWSPTGEAIGFIANSANSRERSLHMFPPSDGLASDVVLPTDGRFIVDFAWMPDGVSLLFTEGGELAGAISGIDLWRVDASGDNRSLLASAGTVAPVARISNIRPSPDGQSVAYAVLVPGSGAPQVDSVWVRDIATGLGFRVSLPSVETVEDLWWTDQGLIVAVTTKGTSRDRPSRLALLHVKPDGTISALWAAPIRTPGSASPVATPVAS